MVEVGEPVGETLIDALERHARERPDARALIALHPGADPEITTWSALHARVRAFTAAVAAATEPDAIVPLYVRRTPECVAAMLGILAAGRMFSVLHHQLRGPQINAVLEASGARLALIDGPGLMTLKRELEGALAGVDWWVLDATHASHRKQRDKLVADGARLHDVPQVGVPVPPGPGGGCCLFTSGSTGVPKGVCIAADELAGRAAGEVGWFGMRADDVVLNVLPFSFDVGLNQLLASLWVGCTLVLSPSFLPADLLAAVEAWGVTGISGVPSLWTGMLQSHLAFDTAGPHKTLRFLTISGGDMLPSQRRALAAAAPGVGIFKTYGQTETFRTASLHPDDYATHGDSVGRAYPGVRLAILREDGSLADPGEEGEVVHAGAGLMQGYLGQPEATGAKLRPCAALGGLAAYTGDYGRLDAEGYLTLLGRHDGMVKISGFRVFPAEILAQISHLDGVVEAVVVPAKDAAGATHLVAFLVPRQGAVLTPHGVRMALGRVLPAYMVPGHVELRDALPRTSSGKPDTVALAAEAASLV
ncbi:MAG: AMP-binding protein [Alphaproteobacteria bacterium]|nr:AMP-binding protein [Alphaproteobacteria bacterium]